MFKGNCKIKGTSNYFLKKYGSSNPNIKIEGKWMDIAGKSWMDCNGNPACLLYAIRSADEGLPLDNNVWYGKINGMGELVHESELNKDTLPSNIS